MSSFYSTIFIKGLSGSTGPTGSTGSLGSVGPIGPNVYGSTGSSIIGITLDSIKRLLFTFEDGSTASSSPIVSGATGSWQARISGQGTNTVFSSSVQGSTGDFIVLKNFKTDTPESIGITLSDDQNSIVINYISTLGGTFTQSELNRLVIGSGTGISSANITNYDTLTKSLDIKIDRYLEGITNVYPLDIPGFLTSQWDLNTDLYSIFNLQPETTINTSKIININSTANDNISRGITVIIPSGITAFASNIEFRVNESDDVLFPMALSIKLTDKLEVVNMISMGRDKWYGSFALWNNDSDININAKTLVFDLLNTGDPVDYGPWKSAELARPSCITQPNSSDIYERPCIEGGSSSGGSSSGGGAGNACLRSVRLAELQLDINYSIINQSPNASVVTNPEMFAKIVATGLPWKIKDIPTGMEMVLIPGGTFTMGSVPSNPDTITSDDERPQHEVAITLPFYMSIHEVTQATWILSLRVNNSLHSGLSNPVENLTRTEVLDFVNSCVLCYLDLPTEAEWEYACRGGYNNQNTYSNNVGSISWNKNNSSNTTHPVMGKLPNALGLYDMLGNVFEYTYSCPVVYTTSSKTDPVECPLDSNNLTGRGGSYNSLNTFPAELNASNRAFGFYRDTSSPTTSGQFGFRVIRRIKP